MKTILTLNELMTAITNKQDLYQEIGGKKYIISFITIMGMTFLNVITMIKEKKLFYDSEN